MQPSCCFFSAASRDPQPGLQLTTVMPNYAFHAVTRVPSVVVLARATGATPPMTPSESTSSLDIRNAAYTEAHVAFLAATQGQPAVGLAAAGPIFSFALICLFLKAR
jgi:hypothetical protein